uniref:Uncharacterized protein n=1 Tax=Ananas comosus var. bracteatus TaxID=296719 RepID=A0A6V7NV52_ANACO|nr:unnamed protein product [Ananas comosus var. bracteatus]
MALYFALPSPALSITLPTADRRIRWELRTDRSPPDGLFPRCRNMRVCAVLRRSADYKPSIWSNNYIQSLTSFEATERDAKRLDELKEEVGRMINEETMAVDKLEVIDALQQLGIGYHFENEIKYALDSIFSKLDYIRMEMKDNAYAIALLFRLLRGHGFRVSQVEGEDTLNEARNFTIRHLNNFLLDSSNDNHKLRDYVARALEQPLHWRMERLHTRWFINAYEKEEEMRPLLLEFAKLDFNVVQNMYKRELKDMSRWWSHLGLSEKLPFSRDRLTENHLWTVGWAFEPKLSTFRLGQTQANSFITAIDDIYDIYGSLDELELFTKAVDRSHSRRSRSLPGLSGNLAAVVDAFSTLQ